MSIKHFIQEIEKGLRAPVYFLYSDDPYLLKEASLMAAGTVPESERGFGLTVFDLGSVDEKPSFDQIADVLNTMPFMGGRKTVIIENVQELSKKDTGRLEGYFANPSPYALLLLLHRGAPKAQFREIGKTAKAIPLDIRPQDFPLWVREKARQKGLALTDSAIDHLLGVIGPDAGLISSELEKLVSVGKSPVDRDDIAAVVSGSVDYSVFDLVDAIRKRDAERAFRIARVLQETADSYGLLGAINWHYSQMSSRERGKAAYYDRVFALLHEADVRIKTSGGVFPMEHLLIRLLRI